ncbi:MAG: DUF58 domain-containing protein [Clostridia bacterium]|nr:DUF58 domain-containing protein [Clostridia bacterium]
MEQSKLCPRCGKSIPAGRTYCMNCGVSVATKCPDCGKILPLNPKTCDGCGHSFVRKKSTGAKKAAKPIDVSKVYRILIWALSSIMLVCQIVFLCLDAIRVAVPDLLEIRASGLGLLSYFLGSAPAGLDTYQQLFHLTEENMLGVAFCLQAAGVLYFGALICALIYCLILGFNLLRFGPKSVRQLTLWAGITAGANLMASLLCIIGAKVLAARLYEVESYVEDGITQNCVTPFVLIPTLLLAGALAALYLVHYKKQKMHAKEKTLKEIFINETTVALASRIRLPSTKREREAYARGKEMGKRGATIGLTKNFWWYLVILGAALVFTQALNNPFSHILFVFLLFLLPVLFLYMLTAKLSLSVYMMSDAATVEKNQPFNYHFRVNNTSIFAYPFVEAQMWLPQHNSVRCSMRTVRLSMSPFASYDVDNTVQFRFRGTYEIGVKCFYVYDFFRLMRVRVDVENYNQVYVLPRRLNLDEAAAQAISDSVARTVRSPISYDRLEVSDIRDYRMGDSLKSIHWKLSSKSEEMIVKEYNTGTANITNVYCDLAATFPDTPPEAVTPEELSRKQKKAQKKAEKLQLKTAVANAKDKGIKLGREQLAKLKEDIHASEEEKRAAMTQPAEANENLLADDLYYEDMNEYLADGVVELTVATLLEEFRNGKIVNLIWFDKRNPAGAYCMTLHGKEDFELIFREFATAPLCPPENSVARLCAMASETQSTKQIFVTGAVDRASISALCSIPGMIEGASFGSSQVMLYNPEERFANRALRKRYIESCRAQLAENGLVLVEGRLPEQTEGR